MRTFAQKQNQPQKQASSRLARSHVATPGPLHHANPTLLLQRTIGNQGVQRLLEANTKDAKGDSTTTETARFGHDFSRIPVYATTPISSVFPLHTGITKAEGKPGSGAEKLIDGGTTPAAEDAGPAIDIDGGTLPAAPMDTPRPSAPPAGMPWKAGVHLAPTFTVTENEGPRSNTDPATTNVDTPAFTGGAAVDAAARMWRYQLKSVEGKGRIKFVYYTKDHYPAPTPNDDSGDLSNVTKANWNDIVKDLESNKTGVAGDWSAYRRTILHERYHWATEWQARSRVN